MVIEIQPGQNHDMYHDSELELYRIILKDFLKLNYFILFINVLVLNRITSR